jgi:CMP-N,N'-diacetyllegionaminic acid synthase
MARILALITARGGSKGIPRKNLSPLAGKPLIAWTLEAAAGATTLDRTVVSTDNDEIAKVCRDWGMEVPFLRPANLSQDDSPHVAVVLHALDWLASHDSYKPDYVMLLQPTSPMRTSRDIDEAVQLALRTDAPAVVSVTPAAQHPYVIRRMKDDGTMEAFVACDLDYARRQAMPEAYALNGAIYLCRRDVFLSARTFEPKGTVGYVMEAQRSLDVDTPFDLRMCETALRDRVTPEDPFVLRGQEHAVFGSAFTNAEEIEDAVRRRSNR